MKKKDLLFVSVLLLVFVALFFAVQRKDKGTYIKVSVDGETVGSYVLTEKEQRVKIGENNVLTIINNEAYMSYALCPDQICVNKGSISKAGEDIVCMPNRVIVRVEGGEDDAN